MIHFRSNVLLGHPVQALHRAVELRAQTEGGKGDAALLRHQLHGEGHRAALRQCHGQGRVLERF